MYDMGKFFLRALLAEKAELLAELPRASARRAKVIREEVAACESLLRRCEAHFASEAAVSPEEPPNV